MKRTCALVILYNGESINQTDCNAIITIMGRNGLIERPEDVTIRFLDAEDIADSLIKSELKIEKVTSPSVNKDVEAAINYIGNACKLTLAAARKTKNYVPLAIKLSIECEKDDTMRHCIKVLSENPISIKKEFLDKYNFTPKTIDTIKVIYTSMYT